MVYNCSTPEDVEVFQQNVGYSNIVLLFKFVIFIKRLNVKRLTKIESCVHIFTILTFTIVLMYNFR